MRAPPHIKQIEEGPCAWKDCTRTETRAIQVNSMNRKNRQWVNSCPIHAAPTLFNIIKIRYRIPGTRRLMVPFLKTKLGDTGRRHRSLCKWANAWAKANPEELAKEMQQ